MSKESERSELARLMAAHTKPITIVETAPMDASLSQSFKQLGTDKKTQGIKKVPTSNVKTDNPVTKHKAKRVKRNWAAQRRYDEEHGTVNGYDPYIEEALAIRRREQ